MEESMNQGNKNNPLSIFPAEIWDVIFNKLEDGQDLVNLLLVTPHPSFDELLKPRKTSFLFPSVVPVLVGMKNELSLDKATILGLRLVSSVWKDGVDKCLGSLPCVLNLDDQQDHKLSDPWHDPDCWLKETNMTFHEPERLEMLQSHLRDYSGQCPILTRSIFIGDHSHHEADPQRTRMWSLVLNLLSQFGDHLHSFEFFSTALRSAPSYYSMLHQALILMPNLKKLQVHLHVQPGDILNEHLEVLLDDSSKPLPSVPHLTHLKMSNVPSVLLNGFLSRYSIQLKEVSLVMPRRHAHLYTFNEIISLESLTYLCLPIRYDHWIWGLERSNWLPNLNTLILRQLTYNFVVQRKSNLENLFGMIATRTSGLLVNLTLEFCASLELEEEEKGEPKLDPRLRLSSPSITRLTLHANSFNLNTIDFILGLGRSLQQLHVIFQENHDDYMDWYDEEERRCSRGDWRQEWKRTYGTLKFFGYWRKMYESNIWELMPKLGRIQLNCRALVQNGYREQKGFHYSRAGWLEHQAEKAKSAEESEDMKWHYWKRIRRI